MRSSIEPRNRRRVEPPEWVVYDAPSRCPYLPGRVARLPMRFPVRPLTRSEFARRLAEGDRRQGLMLYRPSCPSCQACVPLRIDVSRFRPSRTQKRIWRRGNRLLRTEISRPTVTEEKVRLYTRHKSERGLLVSGERVDALAYEEFLVDTCVDTLEFDYRYQEKLVAVSIVDRSADALSAVYTYFDPDFSHLSPGTFSILKQIETCREWGLRYLYLGYYIRDCAPMRYKANFLPHERLVEGEWREWGNEGPAAAPRRPGS